MVCIGLEQIAKSVLFFLKNAFRLLFDILIFFTDVGPTIHTTRTAGAVGPGIYQEDAVQEPQAFVSFETEKQDPDGEEKIVYL